MSSSDISVSVRGVGKQYTLRHQGEQENTLAGSALAWIKRGFHSSSTNEAFWALKDVSFDVKQNQVVDIIGRNGAGKSTLLKILSRITELTKGEVHINGRIGSLLEVGTGFHPELTGRENVFLNGSIIGMKRAEIKKRFDAIVDFAEIERFLDTPVKRYSSGMYTRLAFAVAAHLEPDILIIDEVLSVGDTGFQRKCLSKMHDVAGQGRTVLFVSHNLASVRSICTRAVLLRQGSLILDGEVEEVLESYAASYNTEVSLMAPKVSGDSGWGEEYSLAFEDHHRKICLRCGDHIEIRFVVESPKSLEQLTIGISLLDEHDAPIISMSSKVQCVSSAPGRSKHWQVSCNMGRVPLNAGIYHADVYLGNGLIDVARFSKAFVLQIEEHDVFGWGRGIPARSAWGPIYWAPDWAIVPRS